MVRISFMQVSRAVKSRIKTASLYFALENVTDGYGGPIRSVSALMELLSLKHFDTKVLQANSKFLVEPNSFTGKYDVITTWSLLSLLIRKKNHGLILVFNNQWTPAIQFLGLLSIVFGIKFIWWVRGNLELDSLKKKVVWKLSQKLLIRKAEFIIVSSELGKQNIIRHREIDKNKVLTIPNIMKMDAFGDQNHTLTKKKITPKRPEKNNLRIVYIGRIHKKKKIHNIIANLKTELIPYKVSLTVAGYSDDPEYLKEISRLANDISLDLRILTNISDQQKGKILNESDVFVSMSDRENFGISIFEALCLGIPTIVHRDIEFWPNSGISSVCSIQPPELSSVLLDIIDTSKKLSRRESAAIFMEAWKKIQSEAQTDIVDLFEKFNSY